MIKINGTIDFEHQQKVMWPRKIDSVDKSESEFESLSVIISPISSRFHMVILAQSYIEYINEYHMIPIADVNTISYIIIYYHILSYIIIYIYIYYHMRLEILRDFSLLPGPALRTPWASPWPCARRRCRGGAAPRPLCRRGWSWRRGRRWKWPRCNRSFGCQNVPNNK